MELNEQALEQILTRQRESFEATLDAKLATQREQIEAGLDAKLATQRDQLEATIREQGERIERRMGVIVESLETKIEIVGEVASGIAEELSEVRKQGERNATAIEQLVITDLVR